jgi:hypothetical protein
MRQQRMPAAGDQAHERGLERPAVGLITVAQEVRGDVALQVVNRGERQLPGGR